jgi:hypothetical protein
MSAAKKTIQTPTIKELVSIVEAYNVARSFELQTLAELRQLPGGVPKDYKSPELLEVHFDCALLALRALKSVLEANLKIEAPGTV